MQPLAPAAQSAQDTVYEWVRQFVIELPREQEAFLNELMLASETGTSRTPVREALMRLESEGLLRRIPRKGVYVPRIDDNDVRALIESRALVECWAANAAGPVIRENIGSFRALIDEQRVHSADTTRFIELDTEFHSRMVRLAGNPILDEFYATLRLRQLRIGVRAVSLHGGRRPQVLEEHEAILDAIEANEHIETAIRAHLNSTLAAVIA